MLSSHSDRCLADNPFYLKREFFFATKASLGLLNQGLDGRVGVVGFKFFAKIEKIVGEFA